MNSEELRHNMEAAANRLHHISMRYVGAFAEVATREPVTFLTQNMPVLHDLRDLIDLVLLSRAEVNGLVKLLIDAKVFTLDQFTVEVTEQYDWLTAAKAKKFGFTVTEYGIAYDLGEKGN